MSVVAAWVYRDGRRERPAEVGGDEPIMLQPGEFAWIGLAEPSEQELRALQARFGLHPLAVEDALMAHQLPKVDLYDRCLFVVMRTAEVQSERIVLGETSIFVGADYVITVRHGSTRGHQPLRQQLEASPTLLKHGPDYVLHAVLDYIVDGYMPVAETVEECVLQMEQRALDAFLTRADVTRIFNLRRELMRFRRVLGPTEEVAARLQHTEIPAIDAEVRPYFGDVLDEVRRTTIRVDALREVLSWVFEAGALIEQQRQGAITRKLAAWAAILGAPTMLAGVYGMNFEHMPELHWKYGYGMVVLAMAALCVGLYARFKRTGWL